QFTERNMSPVVIDVVSDVVCPWCYLGKKRLEGALRETGGAEVRWRPFQLDPTIPPQGLDRRAYMAAKFPDPSRLAEAHARLAARTPRASPRGSIATKASRRCGPRSRRRAKAASPACRSSSSPRNSPFPARKAKPC